MRTEPPLITAAEVELADAVPANLFALFRAMTILPGAELMESEHLCYHHAFPTNPMFKGVWRARLDLDEVGVAIDQTLAWFKERNAPFIFWWVDQQTQPVGLPEHLQARGFTPNIVGDPGMSVDLHTLNLDIQTPDGFKIVQAADRGMLEDWRDVFGAAFEVPAWAGQAWVDATVRAGIDSAPWQLYVGYWSGKPVACNILFCGGGVASAYGVGTLPEARRNGIGAAITLMPLLAARDQGYRFGVLFSTELGYPVYRRLGFREVACRIGRYLWRNEQ